VRGLFSAHYCNFRRDRWSRMRAQNECRSRGSRLFARDARVGKRNCDRRVAAPAGERKTRIAFTPDPGAGSRSVPISCSRDCCSGPYPRERRSASSMREICPPKGQVGLVRNEEPSGAVLAQVPAVAVWTAVESLVRISFIARVLDAGINSCSCG
jgi:hypothetical protein